MSNEHQDAKVAGQGAEMQDASTEGVATPDKPVRERVVEALEQVRPYIQMDGGDVEFVDFDEHTGTVQVRLQGACRGCPMAQFTVQMGIENYLRERVPEVQQVVAVD